VHALLDDCTQKANPGQLDTDLDGYGNACDVDYNNDGGVGAPDLAALAGAFGSHCGDPDYDPDVDCNGDCAIGSPELACFAQGAGGAPGPSGLACAGSAPCTAACARALDDDGDGIRDACDNCLAPEAAASQLDTDLDGFGNLCDADYTDDGLVGAPDLAALVGHLGATQGSPEYDPDFDANGDGVIGVAELALMARSLGLPPGPSGLPCAGETTPCGP
jgi:hypothetical protein